MRRSVRIGGAAVLGTLLVLGAFYVVKTKEPAKTGEIVTAPTSLRDTLETQDLNENGIADWKENLDDLAFETINTPRVSTSSDSEEDEEYEPPTTLTGKFSIAFMKDYLNRKINGESFENPDEFIGTAIDALERNTQSIKHSRIEFSTIETSTSSLHSYGNELVEIFLTYPYGDIDVLTVMQDALETNDQETLDEILLVKNSYDNVILDMLNMSVPSELSELHLDLLNKNEEISANLLAMQQIFNDPLYALTHVRRHEETVGNVALIVKTMVETLTKNNVFYTEDELGSLLYIFDI